MQVPHCLDTEVSKEEVVLGTATGTWDCATRTGHAQGKRDTGRAIATRPCAHADLHSAEICSVAGSRLHQGKECDLYSPELYGTEKELQGIALLG